HLDGPMTGFVYVAKDQRNRLLLPRHEEEGLPVPFVGGMVKQPLEEVAGSAGTFDREAHVYLGRSARSSSQFSLIASSAASIRPCFTCSKVAPLPSSVASLPVRSCQRCTTTSTYLGSSSMPKQTRPVISAAASVVPLPRNGSYTS